MTRRERLAHPLDDVPSIKLKLGFVIAAAVAVTVFVFWVRIKIGVWPSVSGIIAAVVALVIVRFLVARHDVAAARDGRRRVGDGQGQLRPPRASDVVARRGRRAGPGVQPDGRRARRDRPGAARPRRQRVARAAHADHRAAGRAREPRRRRQPTPTPRPSTRCSPRSSGSAGWSSSCSTSPGSSRARCRSSAPRSGSSRSSRTRCASSSCTRPRSTVSVVGRLARPHRRRRSRARAPGGRQPARERGAPHARAAASVEVRARRSADGVTIEVLDEGPGIPEAERGPRLRALLPRRLGARVDATAAPVSASPSPSGSSTCTAATSIPNGGSRTAAAWSSPCPHN